MPIMLFGHNTNVTVAGAVYHVQTEDRGATNALIDTTVYYHGRVLHRRTSKYSDLLPLDGERQLVLKKRVDEQHRTVLEEMRSGALPLTASGVGAVVSAERPAHGPRALSLEVANAKSWLVGKRATLEIVVRNRENQTVIANADVVARIEGAASPAEFSAKTNEGGQTKLEFDLPAFGSAEPALVLEASKNGVKAQLRFHLRARPRVPSA